MKTVVILSVSSDIGLYMAKQYLAQGYRVIGTYRTKKHIMPLLDQKNCILFPCDFANPNDVTKFASAIKQRKIVWDVFISCTGYLLPALPFFECNIDQWIESVHINGLEQLRTLHALYPYRNKKTISDVVYFAGSGANSAVKNITAYAISKIILMKMCEYLDAENEDLNVFIVGPGWTKTKIHQQLLQGQGRVAKEKIEQTKAQIASHQTASLEEVFECIEWLRQEGKSLAGGRNFSVVYDPWRGRTRPSLMKALRTDPHMYKLRRHKNSFMQP